jgi:hypothetical protein
MPLISVNNRLLLSGQSSLARDLACCCEVASENCCFSNNEYWAEGWHCCPPTEPDTCGYNQNFSEFRTCQGDDCNGNELVPQTTTEFRSSRDSAIPGPFPGGTIRFLFGESKFQYLSNYFVFSPNSNFDDWQAYSITFAVRLRCNQVQQRNEVQSVTYIVSQESNENICNPPQATFNCRKLRRTIVQMSMQTPNIIPLGCLQSAVSIFPTSNNIIAAGKPYSAVTELLGPRECFQGFGTCNDFLPVPDIGDFARTMTIRRRPVCIDQNPLP